MTTHALVSVDLLAVARAYAADPNEWPFAPRFDPARRWYGRLARCEDHEVWLLSWLPGQSTDLHDHGGSAGALVVVSGELTEQTVGEGMLVDRTYRAGGGHAFGTRHVHRVVNVGTVPAVSVHVYGPALTAMTRYRLDHGELRVDSISRAGDDW